MENFTFGGDYHNIKIRKYNDNNNDNNKRILYYSILCYIY